MAKVTFTLRLPPEERFALEHLSKIEGRPMNQIANEAIKQYLNHPGPREISLDKSLSRLQAYRQRDPNYASAIRAFVAAEATGVDPLEGTVLDVGGVNG